MDVHTPTTHQPTRQAIEAIDRSAPGKVTGRLRKAINYMLEGARRADAAQRAGMTDHSLRAALKKSHVKRYYLDELDVLRSGERVRNFLAAVEVRDQHDNHTARINAIRWLEGEAEQQVNASTQRQSAGITIVIETGRAVGVAVGADTPMLDLQATSTDGGG
jgi:hypothetical protein